MSRLPVSSSEAAADLARECCVPKLAADSGLDCAITASYEDVVGVAPYWYYLCVRNGIASRG